MIRFGVLILGAWLLVSTPQLAAAQQPMPAMDSSRQAQMDSSMRQQMDSLDARLDRAITTMNRSKGAAQMAAVVEALNAIHAHHRAMRAMMGRMGGMGGMHHPGMPHKPPHGSPADGSGTNEPKAPDR